MWQHASSNRAYRLIWNGAKGAWNVAPEIARTGKKAGTAVTSGGARADAQAGSLATRLYVSILAGLGLWAMSASSFALDVSALPSGGQVTAGQAQIGVDGRTLTVHQGSNRAVIDWQSFDIGQDAAVRFNQPGVGSATLNRVTGGSRSEILGRMDANGQVYLVNGAGVLFGQSAQVNVGGLVASTLDISNADFLAGKDHFTLTGASTGEVINQGSITAKGGTVALLGRTVRNEGTIDAAGGNAVLAAGREITFAAGANGHLNIAVQASELQLAVHNDGTIVADGGQIVLNAQGANALASAVVSNTGTLQARTVAEREGKILLLADLDKGGKAEVAGTLDASGPTTGNGGFVETSAANVRIADGTQVTTKAAEGKTGTWLIDPTDFTVGAGSGAQTASGIGANTLTTNLANNNVTLQTVATGSGAGNLNVNAAVTWNAGTTLTLSAHNDININASITASDANGKLALNYGQVSTSGGTADYYVNAPVNLRSGQNFSTQKGSTGSVITYTVVNDANALQAMTGNLAGNYAVGSNIDLSSIANWQPVRAFTGRLDGLGHTLSNLTIDLPATNYVGLFGATRSGSVIRNIGLVEASVSGSEIVGGLVGGNYSTISNVYATGSVTGSSTVGGLVGWNNTGTISNAYATGSVTGNDAVGGLVGYNYIGTISNAYATGSVTGG